MAQQRTYSDLLTSPAELEVRKIAVHDLWTSLREGYKDFNAKPSFITFLFLIYPLAALLFTLFLQGGNLAYLAFPVIAGLTLLGPVMAVAVFERSRHREMGIRQLGWRASFDFIHTASFAPILGLSILMMLIYVAWLLLAQALYNGTLGANPPASVAEFFSRLLTTREGFALILYGNVTGLFFAFGALAISVVAFPLLLDRPTSMLTAVGTSIRAVTSNLYVMLLWGLVVAVLLIAGAAIFLVGLAAVLPILGHATWHLYRKLVR